MGRPSKQHKLVIEAIRSMQGQQFSGWEITRRTGVPRTSVSRIMGHLKEMGFLHYSGWGWSTTGDWATQVGGLCWLYERHLRTRKLDTGAAVCYTTGV